MTAMDDTFNNSCDFKRKKEIKGRNGRKEGRKEEGRKERKKERKKERLLYS